MSKVINVILSGGSGTRLWPLSRHSRPKQFLPLINGKSLFQCVLARNRTLVDDFMLVTNAYQAELAIEQASAIEMEINRRVIEPVGRNTAAAIAYAAFLANPEDVLFVTPSDHMIELGSSYTSALQRATELAREGQIVTFGIQPTFPEVGFGYIECEGENVQSFREKPNLETAKRFLALGNFLWNSGMFCFKAGVFLQELAKHQPEIYENAQIAMQQIDDFGQLPLGAVEAIPDQSVDYAVMEKSDLMKVVPSIFDWTDLGSYSSLVDYHRRTDAIQHLQPIQGASTSFSFSKKKVYAPGLENHVLVETDDCILILPLDDNQLIKEVYKEVCNQNKELTV